MDRANSKVLGDDVYKHPQTFVGARLHSKKSDGVYGLVVVLVEIAYWHSIADVLGLPKDTRAARAMVKSTRDKLSDRHLLEDIEGIVGQDAVCKCLTGRKELRVEKNADEIDPEGGAVVHEVYSTEVARKTCDMRVRCSSIEESGIKHAQDCGIHNLKYSDWESSEQAGRIGSRGSMSELTDAVRLAVRTLLPHHQL